MDLVIYRPQLQLRRFFPLGGRNHLPVDFRELRDTFDNLSPVRSFVQLDHERIAIKHNVNEVRQVGQLCDLVNVANFVVAHVQNSQVLEAQYAIQSADVVVGEPELFQGACNFLKLLNPLDIVPRE